jgi:hypothetical protein
VKFIAVILRASEPSYPGLQAFSQHVEYWKLHNGCSISPYDSDLDSGHESVAVGWNAALVSLYGNCALSRGFNPKTTVGPNLPLAAETMESLQFR